VGKNSNRQKRFLREKNKTKNLKQNFKTHFPNLSVGFKFFILGLFFYKTFVEIQIV